MNWINTEEELPPKDGQYEVTNNDHVEDIYLAYYNGYWFYIGDIFYFMPTYWRPHQEKKRRYGKVKKRKTKDE